MTFAEIKPCNYTNYKQSHNLPNYAKYGGFYSLLTFSPTQIILNVQNAKLCVPLELVNHMDLRCRCGNDCLKTAPQVLKYTKGYYKPCFKCKKVNLKKFIPLNSQMNLKDLDSDFGRCSCGKRHLDLVMAHILKIMIDEGLKNTDANLRKVCVPLITPAYPTNSLPYLPKSSLVILAGDISHECALRIIKEVSEVKGVLKGELKNPAGIKDSKSRPNTYDVLAGCDMRCDVVYTPWGLIGVHKYQSLIHIEFPQPLSPKITGLKKALDKYDRPTVLDCTCGPGTLGIAALKAGARSVVFNDIWYPACEATAMNLELNGFPVEGFADAEYPRNLGSKGLIARGNNFEVYCLDVNKLKTTLKEEFDICIVDVFPGVDPEEFVDAIRELAKEVVII